MSVDRVRVKRVKWNHRRDSTQRDYISVRQGNHFVLIPFDEARHVVDRVHDICDAYESEGRGHHQDGVQS